MQQVKLISITPDAEKHIAYCARVSNPNNQNNDSINKLLKYCIDHKHWSIFEMAFMTLEINTTRGLAAQILRHRSFTFQEFSQRYADASLLNDDIPMFELRRQDTKNRQNSIDDVDQATKALWSYHITDYFRRGKEIYDGLIADGIAKECARFVLPLATPTRLYMSGSLRSWITYIALREKNGTQREHQIIAKQCKNIFNDQFPIIGSSLGGIDSEWSL
jgi:thymidylate synthase (FAD)